MAVNRYSKEPNEANVDFFTVVAWSNKAEFVSRYFKKGQPILICGRLENRSWNDKNGNKRVSTEIIAEEISFVGNSEKTESQTIPPDPSKLGGHRPNIPSAYSNPEFTEIPSDEQLPF